MHYKCLFLWALMVVGCGDGVIVKVRQMPQDRGVLDLDCVTVGALIAHNGTPLATCRSLGRNEFVLPIGAYRLKVYAAGSYDQYVELHIKSMEATKLRIELLKAPP